MIFLMEGQYYNYYNDKLLYEGRDKYFNYSFKTVGGHTLKYNHAAVVLMTEWKDTVKPEEQTMVDMGRLTTEKTVELTQAEIEKILRSWVAENYGDEFTKASFRIWEFSVDAVMADFSVLS